MYGVISCYVVLKSLLHFCQGCSLLDTQHRGIKFPATALLTVVVPRRMTACPAAWQSLVILLWFTDHSCEKKEVTPGRELNIRCESRSTRTTSQVTSHRTALKMSGTRSDSVHKRISGEKYTKSAVRKKKHKRN